jgi:hypothetical protein
VLTRSLRLPALLSVLVLGLLGLAACGGSDNGSSSSSASGSDPEAVLQQTFGANKPIRSGKLDVGLSADLKGLQSLSGPITLRLTGPFQSNGKGELPDFDLAVAIRAAGTSFDVGATATGGKAYLSLQGQAYELGADLVASLRKGFQQSGADASKGGGPSLSSLGIKPLNWLSNPRTVGTEEIGGTQTLHLTSAVDVAKLLEDVNALLARSKSLGPGSAAVPQGLSADTRSKVQRSIQNATVDIWTGQDDRTLRRMRLAVTLAIPTDVRAAIGGLQSGTIALDIRINELNKPQTVTAPKNVKPLGDFSKALSALGFGASGSSGSSSGSGSGSSSSSASEYSTCLEKAGADVADIQKCAALLK